MVPEEGSLTVYEDVDALQQSDRYCFVDYVPYEAGNPDFLELEDYFEQTYLPLFAEKISRMMLKIMYFTSCRVYLTKPSRPCDDFAYDTDIRSYSPEKMDRLIRKVIVEDFSSLQVLLDSPRLLVSVCGGFSVTFYGLSEETSSFDVFRMLVDQEGLFLKRGGGENSSSTCAMD